MVYAGSEAALIQAFQQAEAEQGAGCIGYFYEPQWFLVGGAAGQGQPARRTTEGCDADPEKVACDYPEYVLDKIASAEFVESGSPAADLVKNFSGPTRTRTSSPTYIAEDKMDQAEAAKKWIDDNPDKVDAWLGPSDRLSPRPDHPEVVHPSAGAQPADDRR